MSIGLRLGPRPARSALGPPSACAGPLLHLPAQVPPRAQLHRALLVPRQVVRPQDLRPDQTRPQDRDRRGSQREGVRPRSHPPVLPDGVEVGRCLSKGLGWCVGVLGGAQVEVPPVCDRCGGPGSEPHGGRGGARGSCGCRGPPVGAAGGC